MENLRLRKAAPTSVNVTVGQRSREYLTDREVERLIEAAKRNRSGHRDATAILVAYRHGLRASELVTLRWDDIDLATGRLHVRRAKSGDASVHPISARESRALRKLLREAPTSPYVFISQRHAPLSVAGYQRMVARAPSSHDPYVWTRRALQGKIVRLEVCGLAPMYQASYWS